MIEGWEVAPSNQSAVIAELLARVFEQGKLFNELTQKIANLENELTGRLENIASRVNTLGIASQSLSIRVSNLGGLAYKLEMLESELKRHLDNTKPVG
jgi:hypothetical protein